MKLTYFDCRGRGESIRFLLAAAGVQYEDNRVANGDWATVKPNMPWSQMPVLELDDGTILAQTITICRYLGKRFNLAGATEIEAAKCDEYVDAFNDIFGEWLSFTWSERNPEKKAERVKSFFEITAPNFLKKLDSILNKNGGTHLVGRGLTWADILIGCYIEGFEFREGPGLLQNYPAVSRMRSAVVNSPGIKAWIHKRPYENLAEEVEDYQNKCSPISTVVPKF